MQDLDTLLPGVLTHAGSCPEPTAIAHLRDALVVLCEECRIWVVDDVFYASPDGVEYLFAPPETLIVEFESVQGCGQPLEPRTLQWMRRQNPDWRCTQGSPRYFTQERPNTILVTPQDPDEELHLRAYLKPDSKLTAAPRHLLEDNRMALVSGALSTLLAMRDQDWTDLQLAAVHGARFEQAKNRTAFKHATGQQAAPLRTTPQFL